MLIEKSVQPNDTCYVASRTFTVAGLTQHRANRVTIEDRTEMSFGMCGNDVDPSFETSSATTKWCNETMLRNDLAAITVGSEAGLARLYTATRSRIYSHALRVTRAPHLAAEVSQDVYGVAPCTHL